MRRIPVLCCALAAACSSSNNGNGAGTSRALILLHTNDEHSHLLGFGPEADDLPPATTPGPGTIKGGIARRATLLGQERAAAQAKNAATLTVSAGDNMMGTLAQIASTTAAPDYRLMKLLGYDVTTLGNHEFDYGPASLATIIKTAQSSPDGQQPAGLPMIVSTNIHFSSGGADASLKALFDDAGTDASKPVHRTWVVTASNGLRVGFIGMMGADAASVAPLKAPVTFSIAPGVPESVQAASLAQLFEDIQPYVMKLRHEQNADVVVALSHSGASANGTGEDFEIARHVEGIDVIVSGHSHTEVPAQVVTRASGGSTLVQQAGRFGDNLGRISLSVDGNGKVSFDLPGSALIKVDDRTVGAPAVNTYVEGVITALEHTPVIHNPDLSFVQISLLHAGVDGAALATAGSTPFGLFKFPLGTTSFDVDNSAKLRETPLLKLVADAQLANARTVRDGVQAAIEAAGVVRVSVLEKGQTGQLAFGDIFRAVPLGASPVTSTPGYPLCVTNVYLAELKAAFELGAGYAFGGHDDLFLVPSGFAFEFDTTRPAFNPGGSATSKDNGRVTKILQLNPSALAAGNFDGPYDTVLFDANDTTGSVPNFPGWKVSPLTLERVAANLYIVTFASLAGVTLKDDSGNPIPGNDATQTIVHRKPPPDADSTEIKEWEALGAYTGALTTAAGSLPPSYSSAAPIDRAKCVGANSDGAGACTH